MKNIYIYGASDDLGELESDFEVGAEVYPPNRIKVNTLIFSFEYDNGDWKVHYGGATPKDWIVRKIKANSEFIHIQIPDKAKVEVYEETEEEVPKTYFKKIK